MYFLLGHAMRASTAPAKSLSQQLHHASSAINLSMGCLSLQVSSVTTTDSGAPVKYAYQTTLVTDEYQVA